VLRCGCRGGRCRGDVCGLVRCGPGLGFTGAEACEAEEECTGSACGFAAAACGFERGGICKIDLDGLLFGDGGFECVGECGDDAAEVEAGGEAGVEGCRGFDGGEAGEDVGAGEEERECFEGEVEVLCDLEEGAGGIGEEVDECVDECGRGGGRGGSRVVGRGEGWGWEECCGTHDGVSVLKGGAASRGLMARTDRVLSVRAGKLWAWWRYHRVRRGRCVGMRGLAEESPGVGARRGGKKESGTGNGHRRARVAIAPWRAIREWH